MQGIPNFLVFFLFLVFNVNDIYYNVRYSFEKYVIKICNYIIYNIWDSILKSSNIDKYIYILYIIGIPFTS